MTIHDGPKRAAWQKCLPLLVIAAGLVAYHNSLTGPFIFDDVDTIVENSRLHNAWPIWATMAGTVRPIVDYSFALNYALGGLNVWGYHAVNVAIHLLAALTLYGIVRRTLLGEGLMERYGGQAHWLAFMVATIWVVHPLNTQAVDYIAQRAESLMGLFYLLTLYCVIRGAEIWGHNPISILKLGLCPQISAFRVMSPNLWYLAAVVCCALGMGCKTVMVTAPVMVCLYDRTFMAGSFAAAIRRRWRLYAGLAVTWGVLALVLLSAPDLVEKSAGFGMPDVTPLAYAATQPGVIAHYLRLSLWPHPLVLDYGWPLAKALGEFLLPLLFVGALGLLTIWLLLRRPALGFLGAWFFLILAPTSSFVPLADPAFEYRMVLPLAALCVLFVLAVRALPARAYFRAGAVLGVAITFGWLTIERNRLYADEFAIWQDVVVKRPENARGVNNLGGALYKQGKLSEAMGCYTEALRLSPDYTDALYNMGVCLSDQGKFEEAQTYYRLVLKFKPEHVNARNNLGMALAMLQRLDEAVAEITEALRLRPDNATTHNIMGGVLAKIPGKTQEAISFCLEALRLKPDFPMAHFNLGVVYAGAGRLQEAQAEYSRALELKPDYAEAHNNLGNLLFGQGKVREAKAHYTEAIRWRPAYVEAHVNLGNALFLEEKWEEAAARYRAALKLNPNLAEVHNNLGTVLFRQGRTEEAIEHHTRALELKPDYANAHYNLGLALAKQGRVEEAARHFEAAEKKQ